MGPRRVLKSALIVCIIIFIHMGIAVKADSEEEIDDSHITVLTNKNFDKILKPAKHALVSKSRRCRLFLSSCFFFPLPFPRGLF